MRIVKQLVIFILLFSTTVFSGCKKENMCDCIKRTGDIVVEKRQFSGFDKLYIENNLNLFIAQDSVFDVRVEAGENVQSLIKLEVKNNTLYIRNKNRCNWTRSYKKPLNVYIRMPKLVYLTSDGTGDIKSVNTLLTDTIDIQTMNSGNVDMKIENAKIRSHMHGSGDITLSGTTGEHDVSIGGTAYMYAANLRTRYTYVHTFTLGTCYVDASDILICIIDEQGDIYCTGGPDIIEKYQHASGQLHLQ